MPAELKKDPTKGYPPLLMTTSTRDDRVHPYHARCFVKRLLHVQQTGSSRDENAEHDEESKGESLDTEFIIKFNSVGSIIVLTLLERS